MKITKMLAGTAIAATLAGSAVAGELGNGGYAGINYSMGAGENLWGPEVWTLGDTAAGAYAGYDKNMGSYFLGGELSLTGKGIKEVDDPLYVYEQLLDAKVRVGKSAGSGIFYGVVGFSTANYDGFGTPYTASGMLYGVGAAMPIGANMHVGAEYVVRDYSNVSPVDFTGNVQTATIRVGYNF